MTKTQQNQVWIILASVILALVLIAPTFVSKDLPTWWPATKIKLGLDLRGGSYMVLGVQTNEAVKSQLGAMATSIKGDLAKDRIGIVRARALTDRTLQVTLLGQRGVEPLDQYVLKNFPQLKKAEAVNDGERVNVSYKISEEKALEIEKTAVDQAIETIRNRVDQFGLTEPTIQRSGEKRIIVQLPSVTDIESMKKTIGSVAKLEFRMVADPSKPVEEVRQIRMRDGGTLPVEEEALMTGDVIQTAAVEVNPRTNEVEVAMRFNSVGATLFDRITELNTGRRMAIILDNVGQSAPVIRERISGGNAQISGGFSIEEAHRLAIVLRSGALPAPLTFEEERTVGASLGADSIRQGLISTAVGCLLVTVFMVLYYRKSGMLAMGALALNLVWLLGAVAFFGGTLTLPGIAGLALTVGMAVDSNIIIFERIREELRLGATPKAAIEAGFHRAHWTILDANITTLIIGVILYAFGTGPIKGFAVTLSLGILSTVAAALFASKVGFSVLNLRTAEGKLSI